MNQYIILCSLLANFLCVWGGSCEWSQDKLLQPDEGGLEGEREYERHKHGDEQVTEEEQGQQEPADLHREVAA